MAPFGLFFTPLLNRSSCAQEGCTFVNPWIQKSTTSFVSALLEAWKPSSPDVSVISPMQHLTVSQASVIQGHALSVGEDRKIAVHSASCKSAGVSFIPLIVEILGGWSDQALETIRVKGRLQGQRLGISPAESTIHLFQRLAVCLWRGNAACHEGEKASS